MCLLYIFVFLSLFGAVCVCGRDVSICVFLHEFFFF